MMERRRAQVAEVGGRTASDLARSPELDRCDPTAENPGFGSWQSVAIRTRTCVGCTEQASLMAQLIHRKRQTRDRPPASLAWYTVFSQNKQYS